MLPTSVRFVIRITHVKMQYRSTSKKITRTNHSIDACGAGKDLSKGHTSIVTFLRNARRSQYARGDRER
jgi:hypothetical protein